MGNRHSLVCCAIRCQQCGEKISANVNAVEAHLALCRPIGVSLDRLSNGPDKMSAQDAEQVRDQQMACALRYLQMPSHDNAVASQLYNLSMANLSRISQHTPQGEL